MLQKPPCPLSTVTRHNSCRSIYTYPGFLDQDVCYYLRHLLTQILVVEEHQIWCNDWCENITFIFKLLVNESDINI